MARVRFEFLLVFRDALFVARILADLKLFEFFLVSWVRGAFKNLCNVSGQSFVNTLV